MAFVVGDKASCKATEDLPDLRRVAEEFKTRDIDILAISGGDGTNHCTLTTFIQVYGEKPLPKIVLLRGGTLNTVANSLGVWGSSEKILSNLLVKYHEDLPFETREVNLTNVNGEYGFIFGVGLVYNFMEAYYSHADLSPIIAAWTLFRSIGSALINGKFARQLFDRFDAEVIVDGKKLPYANYSAVYSGSISQLGLGAKTFYLVDRYPDKIHACCFSLPPRNILPYVPWMYFGKPNASPNMIEQAASEMIIKPVNPLPFTIDGDMKPPASELHVTCGPKLTVLVK